MVLRSPALVAIGIGIGAMPGRLTWNGWPLSADDGMAALTVGMKAASFAFVLRLAGRRLLP